MTLAQRSYSTVPVSSMLLSLPKLTAFSSAYSPRALKLNLSVALIVAYKPKTVTSACEGSEDTASFVILHIVKGCPDREWLPRRIQRGTSVVVDLVAFLNAEAVATETIDHASIERGTCRPATIARSGDRDRAHEGLRAKVAASIAAVVVVITVVDSSGERVGNTSRHGEHVADFVGRQDTSLFGRFHGFTPGTGVVRIAASIERFVANDGVKHTNLPVNAIANRRAQGDIRLLDGKRRFSSAEFRLICRVIVSDGVRSEEQVNLVARGP